jgi:hypothetical protein
MCATAGTAAALFQVECSGSDACALAVQQAQALQQEMRGVAQQVRSFQCFLVESPRACIQTIEAGGCESRSKGRASPTVCQSSDPSMR